MDRKHTNQLFDVVHQIDTTLDPYFTKKAPQLPKNIQELLAKLTPYFTIIGLIFIALGLLIYFGLSAVISPIILMAGGYSGAEVLAGGIIGIIFLLIQGVLEALAVQGLFQRLRSAWNLLYASALIGLLYDLVSLNIFGLILHFLITFYILYQIKSYYQR